MQPVFHYDDSPFDVTIIGAGPSGSIAGRKLAEKGLRVMILDKRMEIGAPDICSDRINSRILHLTDIDESNLLLEELDEISVSQYGTNISFFMHPSNRNDAFNAIIAGDRFQKELISLAVNAGSKVEIRSEVRDIKESGDFFNLNFSRSGKDASLKSRYIINASGGNFSQAGLRDFTVDNGVDEFIANYRREVLQGILLDHAEMKLGIGNKPTVAYRVPIRDLWVDNISIQSNGKMITDSYYYNMDSVTTGRVHIQIPSNPIFGNGRFLNIGVSAGLFDRFFFTGYNEAFYSGIAASEYILDCENTAERATQKKYESFVEREMIENSALSRRFFQALSSCTDSTLARFIEYLSGYEFREISLNEIRKRSDLSVSDLLNLLRP